VFTPLVWIPVVVHVWRALRAPSIASAIKDNATWMLLTALVFFRVFSQLAASQMLPSQVLLPFYALGSALIIDRLLDAGGRRSFIAYVWLGFAPLWGFYFMFTQPHSVLDRDEVEKANAYLAKNDRNDFLMSNVMTAGHVQATFWKHLWSPPAPRDPSNAYRDMLGTFEMTGTDYVHAAIFTTPESRFIDKSLWPLAMPRRQWSVTGWPYLFRAKSNRMIGEYDTKVQRALAALEAKRVMRFSNFDLYRLDRATAIAIAGKSVPAAMHIDFGSVTALQHELLGWGYPHVVESTGVGASQIVGYDTCRAPARDPERDNACKTVLTNTGLIVKDMRTVPRATLLIRVAASCDLRVRIELARATILAFEMNGFAARQPAMSRSWTVTVPASAVRPGINELALEHLLPLNGYADIQSMDIDPACR
jgi:hypothetical protein